MDVIAIRTIEAADLGRKTKGIALGLLARADGIFLKLTWTDCYTLMECGTKGSVRRHLAALEAAGLLAGWHTNGYVLVEFPGSLVQPVRGDAQPLRAPVQPMRADAQLVREHAQSVCADAQPVRANAQPISPL